MVELLAFHADAAVIDRLGRELVAKQETALSELIKNGFDADATQVDVVFENGQGPALLIRDNGSGMSREELIDGFLRLASDLKVRQPLSPRFHRQRAGQKGIGRFATQRLGRRLILTTWRYGGGPGLQLSVNWDLFAAGTRLDAVTVELAELPSRTHGTTVRIEQLRDTWSQAQIKRAWRQVLTLQQPFPVAPINKRPDADPGFKVSFIDGGSLFSDDAVVADMETEILGHLHAIIEMQVDHQGNATWRITKNRFGPIREWTPIHHEHRDNLSPPSYRYLRNVWMKAHYVLLDPKLLPNLVYTRVRDVLSSEGGIRLYRNGFRVVPYGEPENDWLGLDEAYTKRAVLVPIANRNFFGVIELRDLEGTQFNEHTSREGLIENPAFVELKQLASSALITAAVAIGADRNRKTRAGTSSSQGRISSTGILERIAAVAKEAQEAANISAEGGSTEDARKAADKAALTAKVIEQSRQDIESEARQVADEMSMLRFLATLGMTTAEFSHETSMTFDAVRLDFNAVVAEARRARPEDQDFASQADRVHKMFDRLDVLTSYLNSLAAARSARTIGPVSLNRAIADFCKGMEPLARSMGVTIKIQTPPFDPLYTVPMHQAEVASVLLNLYTNSVKAMKRAGGDRRVLITADRTENPDTGIRLLFSDTGDGINNASRLRIFEPFFTTQSAPPADASDVSHMTGTGLGLWIIDRIASNVGGEIRLVDPPPGYSTCFEFLVPIEDE